MNAVILALIIALFVVAMAVWAFATVASLLAKPPQHDSVYCMELALKGQYNSTIGPCVVVNGTIYYLQPRS